MPGQILGDRYEVEMQLGKQAGRWTLLARDLATQAPVILKLLFLDDELHPDDLKLFQREVETLQTLQHPAIPKYLGFFEIDLPNDGKALALVQSYVPGTSLQQYMQMGRRLKESEAQRIAAAVLDILMFLHNHQPSIVHRDIKPSNLLLGNPHQPIAAQVSLVDFGSVKSINPAIDQSIFPLVNTNGYSPPEQLARRTVRVSDLFSLGLTLVAGMTGIEPSQLPMRGLKPEIETVVGISPAFLRWLNQMIEPELPKRFASAAAAKTALGSIAYLE